MTISRRQFCLSAVALATLSATPGVALADTTSIQLMQASCERLSENSTTGIALALNWEFDLPLLLRANLRRGIALYFLYEVRFREPRWYWTDKNVLTETLLVRLSYSPLSRQYRLSRNGLSQTFDSLEEVLTQIKHIRAWSVAEHVAVTDIVNLQAEARLHLDTTRLPKPLQVTLGGNSDWILESKWETLPLNMIDKKQ